MKKITFLFRLTLSFACLISAQNVLSQTTIVTSGDSWKYYYNTSAPANDGSGNTWKMNAFNDTAWTSGASKLGNDNTPATSVGNNPVVDAVYFRKTFTVADASIYEDLDLRAIRDDGIVVYLNGTEIWRDNMPTGTIVHGTLANSPAVGGANETTWFESLGVANTLVTGSNTLAIEVHQQATTSSDISFDFELIANPVTLSNFGPGGSWKYLDDGSNQGTTWYGTGFDDSSWAEGNAELGFGDGDETTTVADVNQMTTYFRKTVNITAAEAAMSNMILDLTYDDGAVVYINGTEVWRVNMPGGTINYLTASSTVSADNATASTTLANVLTTGTNVIAVEIHQNTSTSSDISFNFDIDVAPSYLVNADGSWYYLDDGTDQGTAWQTADVTPTGANWASGNAELGYGDGDETTVVGYGSNASNKYPTTYFRKSFTVSAGDVANLSLRMNAIRDDGMVVYIDGVEVWRDNISGTVNYTTYSDAPAIGGADESTWITKLIANPFSTTGTHEVAVEIHQVNATSSDLSFNFEMYTGNEYIFIPPPSPDNDGDGVADYIDSDDDNDGIADVTEGCYTAGFKDLNSTGVTTNEESITSDFPINNHSLDNGDTVDLSITGTFNNITSYYAGEHGWAIRVHGPSTSGTLTFDFDTDISGLFFKLVDFDENENWTVNAYDDSNTLIDLTTSGNVYHLGSYVEQSGNSFFDVFSGTGTNNNGDTVAADAYGTVYLYFPTTAISKIDFIIDQPDGSTIRLAAMHFCDLDTDGDGVEDYNDSDSDNDSIPDLVEAGGTDIDGDGIIDSLVDTDGDGLADTYDVTPNVYFAEEITTLIDYDFDNDGAPSRVDLDSDNDGILDIIEAGDVDTNGDGQIDSFVDANSDGYHDAYDGTGGKLITGADTDADGIPNSYPNGNIDGTGLPNFMDIDSDDDGITDNTEAQATGSYVTYGTTDSDGDGIANVFDNSGSFGGNGLIPIDSDFDCIPDYLDTNSDFDSEDDIIEGHDTNGDGVVNGSDSPSANTGLFTGTDTDADGLDDGFDNNNSTYSATNNSLEATNHPIYDGLTNRDWRASDDPIDFDGTDDFVDFGDQHDFTSSFSLEAWVLQEATSGSEATIMSKADAKSGNRRGYQLTINSSNQPNFAWYNSSGTAVLNITSAYAITNNKWYHIAATYDGSAARLYVDGLEVATGTTSTAPTNGSEKFMIGAMYDSDNGCTAAAKYFNGYIDEVRLWDVALSATQLREMMNQEIQNISGNVRGSVLPNDISGSLTWTGLKGYYPMNTGRAEDQSGFSKHGVPKYISSTQIQTAPLPYTTVRNGTWKDTDGSTPWTYGNTVWNAPNAIAVDSTTPIDWNIVVTDHDVMIETNSKLGRERTVLGLIVDSNQLLIEGDNSAGTGNGLTITNYLELNGEIDLDGESQLIQSPNSELVVGASGKLYRDQQGTADTYTYNYWSSPVGITDQGTHEYSYKLPEIIKDGTLNINFITSGYDGTNTSPIGIADYWIWKFANQLEDDYASWQHIRSTGDIYAGEGFTMKGPGTGGISTDQNYAFSGKPNNGDINLTISAGNDYLVGNPYASSLDAYEFIIDNSTSITGTLYFWEHWGGGNHILGDYQGGYHVLNLSGSTTAATLGSNDPDVGTGGTPVKTPGNFIPVSQGFFVIADSDGGTINFNNSQRVFHKESSGNSTFVGMNDETGKTASNTNATNKNTSNSEDSRLKIRIGFNSVNTIRRQLLTTVDSNATESIDWGYDGKHNDAQLDDMFWLIENQKFVIQGINQIDELTVLPIGIYTNNEGLNSIVLDDLENAPESLDVYLYDKTLDIYHDLKDNGYEIFLPAGEYLDRFEITFSNKETLSIDDISYNKLDVHYSNTNKSIVLVNPTGETIKSVEIINVLGQNIMTLNSISNETYKEIEIKNLSSGAYIIKLNTANTIISKKVLVD